jgi:hypothetical protein
MPSAAQRFPVLVVCLAWIAVGPLRAADPAPAPAQPAPATKLADFTRWVIASDYARDNSVLLTAGGESLLYRPGDVVVWNAADGARLGDLAGHPTAVWSVKASTDGKLAATAGYDGLVKLWDLPARSAKHDLKKHKGWVRSLDFSPDGTKLATAGEDGTVVIWDTATGAEVKTVAAHSGAATCVAFSRDGATIASGGSDKLVKLWDAATGNEKAKLEGHGDALWTVVYSPDGSKLATAGADRTVKLWTTSDAKEFASLTGHKDWVTSAAFSPDGSRLTTGSLDGAVKLWDVVAKGEQEGPEPMKSSVWSVSFTPDGKSIFVGTHAGGRLLPTPAAKLLPPPPPPAPPASQPQLAAIVPSEFKSAAGATGTIAADGAVTVGGTRAKDTYTLKATVPAGAGVKAVKLEVLPDPSLPQQGPGRADNGNFVLSAFTMSFGNPGAADTPTAVKFAAVKADFDQGGEFVVAGAIDDNPATGWGIAGGAGKEHAATFDLPPDVKIQAGAPLVFTLDQQYADGSHSIGKFRISILQEPAPAQP